MTSTQTILLIAAGSVVHATPSCEAPLLDAAASFRENGYAVLRQFASEAEVAAMREAMQDMVAAWWRDESQTDVDNVFVTGDNQTKAQAASRYFFDSAARVHFFREPGDAPDDGSAPALTCQPCPPSALRDGSLRSFATVFGGASSLATSARAPSALDL